jgi:hypothetical protein
MYNGTKLNATLHKDSKYNNTTMVDSTTLGVMTLSIIAISIMTRYTTTVSTMTFGRIALSIMTLYLMALILKPLSIIAFDKNRNLSYNAEHHYAKCHFAVCRGAKNLSGDQPQPEPGDKVIKLFSFFP